MKNALRPVSAARQQIEQRRARLEASEARLRKREERGELRKKILVGAWLFSRLGSNVASWPSEYVAALDAFVTRPHDRRTLGFGDSPDAAFNEPQSPYDADGGG